MNTAQYTPSSPAVVNQATTAGTVLIDNIAKHPTPEGLLLTLMPAGLMPRLWAWLIDVLIKAIIIIVVAIISAFFGTAGAGIIAITYFIITWLYPVYFEVYRSGMTPGKKRLGIYVCHDDGTPISLPSSMVRNLLRVADFLPFGFATGILTIMFTQRSQRMGDIVAGTLVVYKQQDDLDKLYKSIYGFSIRRADNHADSSLPTDKQQLAFDPASPLFLYPLRLHEQQAMVAYKERLDFLSVARQQEIAYALAPLVKIPVQNAAMQSDQSAAVQQAVLQKAMMIEGQPINSHSSINNSYHSHANRHRVSTGVSSVDTVKINTGQDDQQ